MGQKRAPDLKLTLILAGIVLLSLGLRLVAAHLEPLISRDSVIYLELAENWASGAPYPANTYLPGVPWLIKLLIQCGVDSYWAGLSLNLVLGSLLPVIVYAQIRLLVARRSVALAGALLTAWQPFLIEVSSQILRDTPYLFCAGLALYCMICAIKHRSYRQWIFCGLFLAAGALIRYETLELLLIVAGYLMGAGITRFRSGKQLAAEFGVWSLAFVLAFAGLSGIMGVSNQVVNSYEYRFKMIFNARL